METGEPESIAAAPTIQSGLPPQTQLLPTAILDTLELTPPKQADKQLDENNDA